MDFSMVIMWLGFFLAAYSVVGNDVIQTLGTFLTSNEDRLPWYVLFLFAFTILAFALINGYIQQDVSYGRLEKFTYPEVYKWYYLLPPLVLLWITRTGIPVSTTFMILTLFSIQDVPADFMSLLSSITDTDAKLGGMIYKSIMGYVVALFSAIIIYLILTRLTERYFLRHPMPKSRRVYWMVAQWCTTAFLWFQWLTQDLANIYIYLRGGSELSIGSFSISIVIIGGLLAYIFYQKGGAVQDVVRLKTNTADIRSATFIDLIYGIILYIFKYDYFGLWGGKLPMSTTWIFIGLLAGREIGMRVMNHGKVDNRTLNMVFSDLGKVFFGLLVSVILVFLIKLLSVI